MIEKLEPGELRLQVFADKINELIDAHNRLDHHFEDLVETYRGHYHKSLDTQYFTTSPHTEPVRVEPPPSDLEPDKL